MAARARVQHLTVDERRARGKEARNRAPLSSHDGWAPSTDRPDPVGLLEEQNRTREPDLLPVRHGGMLVSPFSFYRGTAKVMAADLKDIPTAGLQVQLCGDAHLSNFGLFASPERRLLFDLNDFDETLPGPFDYDVKRLAASFTIAARNNGFASPTPRRPRGRRWRRAARRWPPPGKLVAALQGPGKAGRGEDRQDDTEDADRVRAGGRSDCRLQRRHVTRAETEPAGQGRGRAVTARVRADSVHHHDQRQDRAEGLAGEDDRAIQEAHLDQAAKDPSGQAGPARRTAGSTRCLS
jgi:hypothetical protein